ncbi:MAG: uncharacterized protein H6R26_3466, partial [Proteobacteria bacterium]|nr:uncharacterized protein [Pseudomonadota bacterium]
MKFRFFDAIGAVFLAGALGSVAWADVQLKDRSEIQGQWLLEAVAPGIDKAKIAENRTWDFRADGTVVTSGFNRHFGGEDTQTFKYEVVDGKIKADNPGRPGKTLDYKVYEKSGDKMILQ